MDDHVGLGARDGLADRAGVEAVHHGGVRAQGAERCRSGRGCGSWRRPGGRGRRVAAGAGGRSHLFRLQRKHASQLLSWCCHYPRRDARWTTAACDTSHAKHVMARRPPGRDDMPALTLSRTRQTAARDEQVVDAHSRCTGAFMLLLDVTIVNVALPDIERAFGASLSDLQWVISAYALTLAAFLLTAGSLADLYGRRLLFATGIVVFTGGSLCCGLATSSLSWPVAGRPGRRRRDHVRDVAGAARPGVSGPRPWRRARALRRDHGHRHRRSGRCSAARSRAASRGAGSSTSTSRSAIVALAITLLRVEESRDPSANRPDWVGFVTFSAGARRRSCTG